MKTVSVGLTEPERFAVYVHFTKNVVCQNGREQDEYDDIWQSLGLEEIHERVKSSERDMSEKDFDDSTVLECELTKEEIGYMVKFCTRPMMGSLSMFVRPVRKKFEAARDKAGLKSVPSDEVG
jgi:hypothetical protein